MPNAKSTLLYQWFNEVWNNGDESAIDRLFHQEGIANSITSSDAPKGPEGFKIFYQGFKQQFADVHVQVNEVIREEDFESARCTVYATERSSGRKVQFEGMCMARIVDGQIAEAWNNFDFLEMYTQLGQKLVQV